MAGPLKGIRIIEFAGIGPGPFCGMMLADHGADVIRIERPAAGLAAEPSDKIDVLVRSRRSIVLDMKQPEAVEVAKALCKSADGIIEGYRPGVMERLGLGPDVLLGINPKLIYGRMTGWGQFGPYAQSAGHDINYIALSGILHTVARNGNKPLAPVNYLGDFAGGGMMLAYGMVSALLGVKMGGSGQVIDCAMTDGSALIGAMTYSFFADGTHSNTPGESLLDGGAHFYDTYECSDGKYISLGAIEPQFYALFRDLAGLKDDPAFDNQMDKANWHALKVRVTALFKTKTRDAWCALMEMTDVCFAPVLSLTEAPQHPHNIARETFVDVEGVIQPAPAPRYSNSILAKPSVAPDIGADADSILSEIGYDSVRIVELQQNGTLGRTPQAAS